MNVDSYINRLKNVSKNHGKYVMNLLEERKGYVLGIPKQRLYQKGTDANDLKIKPAYKESTIERKRRKGKRTSHVTLNYTGKLWRSFKLIREGNSIDFTVPNNDVTDFLTSHYSGNELFGFSPKDAEEIYRRFIEPPLEELIYPKDGIDIDF
jgi:hypothetical protein